MGLIAMKKRYCIFSAQFLPHMGGVERYTYYLAKELLRCGNAVTVVANNTTGSPQYECMEGIEVYRFPCYALVNGRFPVPQMMNRTYRKINRILNQKMFDMVIINTRFYIHSLYAAKYAEKKGIYSICIEHGTSHLSVHNAVLDRIGAIYEHFHTSVLKRYCKNFYGVSKACTEWSKHFQIQPKGVLYNSLDLDELNDIYQNVGAEYRKRYGIPDDGIVISFTGRLLKEKGIPSLLSSIEKIQKKYNNIYLIIAGDGDLKEEIEKRKSKHIIPLGKISYQEVVRLLKETDIFCLPSFSEGMSTSVLEAAACKCFIITTERGGAKELLNGKEYGTIIPNNQEDVLYNAICEAVENPEHRKKAVEKTYQKLEESFNWKTVASQVEKLCNDNS